MRICLEMAMKSANVLRPNVAGAVESVAACCALIQRAGVRSRLVASWRMIERTRMQRGRARLSRLYRALVARLCNERAPSVVLSRRRRDGAEGHGAAAGDFGPVEFAFDLAAFVDGQQAGHAGDGVRAAELAGFE